MKPLSQTALFDDKQQQQQQQQLLRPGLLK